MFFEQAAQALIIDQPEMKAYQVLQLRFDQNAFKSHPGSKNLSPGYPPFLKLVPPKFVRKRKLGSLAGRLSLYHALAHIEYNAIHLALDACIRFENMPAQFYADWLRVAKDEARHFLMLNQYMQSLGGQYGDFEAHHGLWTMAEKTAHDVMVRMALVPRVLEARGLDMAPVIQDRLRDIQDDRGVELLEVIRTEEIEHVKIGNHWFHTCCQDRGLSPNATFIRLVKTYAPRAIRPPINQGDRARAGFSQAELDWLIIESQLEA